MTVTEDKLVQWHLCPLEPRLKVPLESAAGETLAWGLREAHCGALPELRQLRSRFEAFWEKAVVQADVSPRAREFGFRKGGRVAKVVWELLGTHKVRQPITPYRLVVEGHTIEGQYGLVQRPTPGSMFKVIMAVGQKPSYVPGIGQVALARWLHARREHDFVHTICLEYVPLLAGKRWHVILAEEALVLRWLGASLKKLDPTQPYPAPGEHCRHCLGRRCEAVRGRNPCPIV